jgi:PPOX class probable F420-dependent enzyme
MSSSLSDQHRALLTSAVTGTLVTIGPDGSPHAAPVWFMMDGESIIVSTRTNSQKHRNVIRDGRVSFSVIDPANPMSYVEVRGVAAATDDPTCAARDRVVRKHGFADGSGFDRPGTSRVSIAITPGRTLGR